MQSCNLGNISFCKKMSKIKLNLLFWNLGFSKTWMSWALTSVTVKNCFWVCFFFFSEFSLFCCNKVIFCTDVRYSVLFLFDVLHRELKCYMRVKLTMPLMVVFVEFVIKAIFVAVCFCHWLCSQDVIVEMYMVFLYILVFALYVQNRKSCLSLQNAIEEM